MGLGHHFLTEAKLDTVMEGLMITPLGQRLLNKGVEQGQRRAVLQVLTERFGTLPESAEKQLAPVEDSQRLDALLSKALTASNVNEFMQALEPTSTNK